jgi:hypothetical protein
MRTIGLIRAATRPHEHDLLPRLRARIAASGADERVRLELPEFSWPWRLATAAAASVPFLVPEPVHFLVASGLL